MRKSVANNDPGTLNATIINEPGGGAGGENTGGANESGNRGKIGTLRKLFRRPSEMCGH